MEKENKTSYEQIINIKRKLASDIDEKMRNFDLSSAVIIAGTEFRTFDDGDYCVSAHVVHFIEGSSNSVNVTCYSYDDYDTNKSKAAFFLNQMEAFFAYAKRMSNNSKE